MNTPLPLERTTPRHAHGTVQESSADGSQLVDVAIRLRPPAGTASRVADEADVAAIDQFARRAGLGVLTSSASDRVVIVRASIDQFGHVFRTEFKNFRDGTLRYRSHADPLHLPGHLHDRIEAILGLDDRPQLKRKLQRAPRHFIEQGEATASYTASQIAALYNFPAQLDGSGQTIGIITLGGGYTPEDFQTYFSGIGIAMPRIVLVCVGGATNAPGADAGNDAELLLDVEVAGAAAPGATIVIYLAPDSDQGFVEALDAAVHDTTYKPSVLSMSCGQPEYTWSAQLIESFDTLLAQAQAAGITVCAASGDAGSSCGVNDGKAHVEFPASIPRVLACGGTNLQSSGEAIVDEVVWNELATGHGATGGGISDLYGVPAWQADAKVPPSVNRGARRGRGVPDVAADADKNTGYRVYIGGRNLVAGGTSAAAPLWAALCARLNQGLGTRAGFLNERLYTSAARAAFRTITQGNNGAYAAREGWSACTGLGTPNGTALLNALR